MELRRIFNANPIATQARTFGGSLGRPVTVLNPRLIRFGLQIHF